MHVVAEAPTRRRNRARLACLLGSALLAASASALRADTAETLQGAWVQDSSDCNAVFEKVQGRVQFKDRNFADDSGFIISGSKGKGPAGSLETMQRGSDQEASLFKLNLWLGRTLWGMMLRKSQQGAET